MDIGDLAKMRGDTVKLKQVLEVLSDFDTGVVKKSEKELAELAGMQHVKSVPRAIRQLREMGYLSIVKEGRENTYQLYKKIPLKDENGAIVGMATWPYVPKDMEEARKDLKQALLSGDLTNTKYVHIELNTPPEPSPSPSSPPEVPPAPSPSPDPPKCKDPELQEIIERLGALVDATVTPAPAIGNTAVTYHVIGNTAVAYHPEQITRRLPITGEQITRRLPIGKENSINSSSCASLREGIKREKNQEGAPGSLLAMGEGETEDQAHAATGVSVEEELRRLLGGYPR
jgi:hypothetical protein